MTAFQIVHGSRRGPILGIVRAKKETGKIDLLVGTMNLTARVAEADCVPALRDFSHALADLVEQKRSRVTVRYQTADGTFELGMRRWAQNVLLSVFRGGSHPEIAVFERPIAGETMIASALTALGGVEDLDLAPALATDVALARARLASARWEVAGPAPSLTQVHVEPASEDDLDAQGEPGPNAGLRFAADVTLREEDESAFFADDVQRADLFPLLVRGTITVGTGDRTRRLGETFVFLLAEALLGLADDVFDAWEQGRALHRRVEVHGILLGARLLPGSAETPAQGEGESGLWLTVGDSRAACTTQDPWTLLLAGGPDLARAATGFARAVARTILRHCPGERNNLRFGALRQSLRSLDERLHDATVNDAKVNPSPESYRAFAARACSCQSSAHPPARLRFSRTWTVTMPRIDLRATFLCGDHLVIGAARETAAVDRHTGDFVWRHPTDPAVSVFTPTGIARLSPDGTIRVHDFGSGEVGLTTRVSPRAGGVVAGAVVNAPGLPRMLIVTEGERHLSAVDLGSGEVRWRHPARRGQAFRLKRAGKLLVVACGDATLTALDVASGEAIWRVRDRLRFSTQVGLDRDSLFCVSGQPDPNVRGQVRLYHLDPYAGTTRWVRPIAEGPLLFGAPLVCDQSVVLVTRDRRGLGFVAFDRATGSEIWSLDPGAAKANAAWLAVDDKVVLNSDAGDTLALSARTGEILWRHRLARGVDGDQPRRLEPILRSGALFIPQSEVHVVSPRDGTILGRVETDIIPDLLRVDERCDVYVAEESGHLAAFRAGAKLSLV
jgi:outer membrane protein assembly factor BamB